MDQKQKYQWHSLSIKDVFQRVHSRPGGLTSGELAEHRRLYGRNVLPQAKSGGLWRFFLSALSSPLVFVLFAAAIISGAVGDWLEVYIIMAAVVINTIVGVYQEYKADRALLRLTSLLMRYANVERDGRQQRLPASEVIVGDLIVLHAGDSVPADARLIEVNRFQANEAALTGESVAVEKRLGVLPLALALGDRRNMVFAGTIVAQGTARAVVVAVGTDSQIGAIAGLVDATKQDQTPLQKQLVRLSRFLTVGVLGMAVLLFFIGAAYRLPLAELVVVVAALAVAAIPEGLLVSLTIVLVIGMQRLLRHRGLVRKLLAAETLGAVTVVCTDKTGTLTKGVMQVARIVVHGEEHGLHGHDHKDDGDFEDQHLHVLKAGLLCNDSYIKNPQEDLSDWEVVGDQTDAALLLAAVQAGFERERTFQEQLRLDAIPFDERYKFMATLHHVSETEHMLFVKGAPETVLAMCGHAAADGKELRLTPRLLEQLQEEYRSLAQQGLRVLAVASKPLRPNVESFKDLGVDIEHPHLKDLVFAGWVGLKDPVRSEVRQVFETMKQAGIRPMIITGDHPETVRAVANELGWSVAAEEIMTGQELDDLPVDRLIPFVQRIRIFARVEPKHKVRIVQALQAAGEVVAMFGDGVNDAPALKAADIAVVVNSGTDIAKETADLVLLDDHFGVITRAIREGRTMFDNIRRIFLFLVSDSFAEVVMITAAMVAGLPMPLTAIQILWMNLISDTLPNLALTLEGAQDGIMTRRPRSKLEPIVNKEIRWLILITTAAAACSGMALYLWTLYATKDLALARTVVFCMMSLDSLFYVFSIRHLSEPLLKTGFFQNIPLLVAVACSAAAQVAVIYVPVLQKIFGTVVLRVQDWGLVILFGLLQILVIELAKVGLRRRWAAEKKVY